MTERDFQTNARAADTFRRLSQEPEEQDFWAGYVRGLRRNYHGENFGTADEHSLWMSAAGCDDLSRKMRGLGYQTGFDGQNVQQAMKLIASRQYMSDIGKIGGSAKSEKKTAAVRLNAKKGGRPPKKITETN